MGWSLYIQEYSAVCLPVSVRVAKGGESGPVVGTLKIQEGDCPTFPNIRTLKKNYFIFDCVYVYISSIYPRVHSPEEDRRWHWIPRSWSYVQL